MHIVIVAGEASGDILGASLIQALKKRIPEAKFSGVGGEKMCALGFESLFPIDRLSVMGIIEPLKRLPELLNIRKTIKNYCLENQADLFIGIDSPDFNLPIEKFLKEKSIKTVHYVSPSVWAWRQGRIKNIKKSVDLMLTLLPFEARFYEENDVPVEFIGHTLADEISIKPDQNLAKEKLSISSNKRLIALMPGSRSSEVALLGDLFLNVAQALEKKIGHCKFLIPAANTERKKQILEQLKNNSQRLDVEVYDGNSHTVMEASDAVLLASGTTALEAMLFKKPMVVSYKMSPMSYAIISRLVKSKYVALPNLLAGEMLVPELLQDEATIENLSQAMEKSLLDQDYRDYQVQTFHTLHETIRCDASEKAADAIKELLV